MTIPNRTVSITGVFAENALTTIPATPVPGTSYRDTTMTSTAVSEGWAYKTIVDSAQFNQALYQYSYITKQFETYGFLPWSNLTDYVQGSVCLGSDGGLYQAKQATGPSSTAYDPTTNSNVWKKVTLGNEFKLFHHDWFDYELQDQNWIKADNFSWQDGTVYTEAYTHLENDLTGISSETETIGSYTITYYTATDGHKIVMPDQETTVQNIYAESGVAWYYIVDTANQRFKLPRTKWGFVGLRDTVGKYVSPGLPNITGVAKGDDFPPELIGDGAFFNAGAYSNTATGSTSTSRALGFDASRSNPIYGASTTVQPPATQMYLYFYVGQFSQTATEQTAGLNATLFNAKVDLDAQNLSTEGKEFVSTLPMPSGTYDDLTLGASGATYLAPANGYFCAKFYTSGNGYIEWDANNFRVVSQFPSAAAGISCYIPVKKGDTATFYYNNAGMSTPDMFFRFVYAQGEV